MLRIQALDKELNPCIERTDSETTQDSILEDWNDYFLQDISSNPFYADNVREVTWTSYSAPSLRGKKKPHNNERSARTRKSHVLNRSFATTRPFQSSLLAPLRAKNRGVVSVKEVLNCNFPREILFAEIKDLRKVEVGRNSVIFKAIYDGETVAVKLMMPGLENSELAQREFDMEQQILASVNHPNVVRLIGCGCIAHDGKSKPQRFTVLEWLDQTLHDQACNSTKKFPQNLFLHSSSAKLVPFVVPIMTQVCSVLKYLHGEVESTKKAWQLEIVHRAVTADHFRYNGDPVTGLKLISFMNCQVNVFPSSHFDDSCSNRLTCSAVPECNINLCSTAPEVAMRISSSTKSDIYAFSMLCWQLLKRKNPYGHMTKTEFMTRVVYDGERPKLSSSWPIELKKLFVSCWMSDPFSRPDASDIYVKLREMGQLGQHRISKA